MSSAPTDTHPLLLRVTAAALIAEDIHSFELRDPSGAALPEFSAGAHIGVRLPNGMVRKYSLCNDPAERDRYVIAVKREANGQGGSQCLIRDVGVGHELPVSAPRNNFALVKAAAGYLFIAGGIGITPIMAMIRHLAASGRKFRLYYCTRSPEATAFRDELAAFRGQVTIHHDQGDPARSLDLWPILEKPAGRQLYCCGPRGMMEMVRDMSGHWSPSAVHFEAFTEAAARKADDTPFRVRLARTGEVVEVPAGVTILDALRARGLDVPSSCESGTCGTCRTRLVAGAADHRDLVLSEGERAACIMVCVSRALSDELVIDR
jgi:phthalate 4,5-dioxygenase reductase subunit